MTAPQHNGQGLRQPKDSKNINPKGILAEIVRLQKEANKVPAHVEILGKLLTQIQPVNFQLKAFPQAESIMIKISGLEQKIIGQDGRIKPDSELNGEREDLKYHKKELEKLNPNRKHFIILTIQEIETLAKGNNWGLCKNQDCIYLYNGNYWKELDRELFQKFLGEAAEKMGVPKFDARFFQFREHLFKQFLSISYLPTPDNKGGNVLINLKNGTFEISPKGETNLWGFNRDNFLTYQLPFEYNKGATAPIFHNYLDKVLPDIERQKVLAEYLGYIFMRNGNKTLKEEKALILYGTGANGKSVFFEVVNALLGRENVSNYSLTSLTEEKGFYRVKIANKLINYASEINGKLETSIFKQLVSGEPVEACQKYGQPFTMEQYAKLIFNCNELPKDVEHSIAYFRRFLIIPFDVTIPESEQDKSLHTKIIENELSGVFNWVLSGLHRLLKQRKFSNCEAARKTLETYKLESNSVQMFLAESGYKKSPDRYEFIKDLYQRYRGFCIEDGTTPFKKINFIKQLRALGLIVSPVSHNQLAVFIKS